MYESPVCFKKNLEANLLLQHQPRCSQVVAKDLAKYFYGTFIKQGLKYNGILIQTNACNREKINLIVNIFSMPCINNKHDKNLVIYIVYNAVISNPYAISATAC